MTDAWYGANRIVTIVAANDRLLKALVTLLAIRDPVLMEELSIMFGADAVADNAVSAHLQAEVEKVAALARAEEFEPEPARPLLS